MKQMAVVLEPSLDLRLDEKERQSFKFFNVFWSAMGDEWSIESKKRCCN